MLPFSRLMANAGSAPPSAADLTAYERPRRRQVSTARPARGARYTQPAAGVAIVPESHDTNMDAFVRMLTPRETPEDKMMLVGGAKPTFVSRGSDCVLNKRQKRAQLDENNLRAQGLSVPPKKSALRKRMEKEGCILFTDGYVDSHKDSQIASLTAPYRQYFPLNPPQPAPRTSLKKQRTKLSQYLISEAELEHRPLFLRIDSDVIYGEPQAYTENTGNSCVVPAVSTQPASPAITHTAPPVALSKMMPTWSAFSLDGGVSSSSSSSSELGSPLELPMQAAKAH